MDDDTARLLSNRQSRISIRRATLEQRLDDGYRRIEHALGDGADVSAWEDFWIQLLWEYEAISDEFKLAA